MSAVIEINWLGSLLMNGAILVKEDIAERNLRKGRSEPERS